MRKLIPTASLVAVAAAGAALTFNVAIADDDPNQPAPAGTYSLDPAHTSVVFNIEHMNIAKVFGRFNEVSGSVNLGDEPSLEVTIPVASIDTANDQRDQHLRSADFFDARQYPEITFRSTGVEVDEEEYEFTGELTMHGQTREVELELDYNGTATQNGTQKVGFGGEITIDRTNWGMENMVGPVGRDVKIYLEFEAAAE